MSQLIEFEDTSSFLLAKVGTAFRNSLERFMAPIGLHAGQVFVLIELWRSDGMRQIDLAERLDVAAPTVNKTVKGMIELGLVKITRLVDDARSTRIFLTDRGRSIRPEIEGQWLELEEDCLSSLTETERLVLFDLIGKLRNKYTGRIDTDDD